MENLDNNVDLRKELDVRIRRWMDLSEVDPGDGLSFRLQVELFLECDFHLARGEGTILYDAVIDFLCGDMLEFFADYDYVVGFDVTTFLWNGVSQVFSDRGFDYWKFVMDNNNESAVRAWLMAARYTLSHVSNFIKKTSRFGPNGLIVAGRSIVSSESCLD